MANSKPTELTGQQRRFVDHYVVDKNGTQAAISAGYSKATAGSQASRLLKNEFVKTEIANRLSRSAQRADLSAATTLEELRRILTLDPAQIYDEQGSVLPVPLMPIEIRACIASVKVKELWDGTGVERKLIGQQTEVRFWSKSTALLHAMQHFDLIQAAGLTLQLRTQEQETKAEATRRALTQLIERQKSVWHGAPNVVPIKTNGHDGNGAA